MIYDSITITLIAVDVVTVLFFVLEIHRRKFLPLTKVESVYWKNKTVHVDGWHFVNCRFDRCQFETDDLNYKMTTCQVNHSPLRTLFFGQYITLKLHHPSPVPVAVAARALASRSHSRFAQGTTIGTWVYTGLVCPEEAGNIYEHRIYDADGKRFDRKVEVA